MAKKRVVSSSKGKLIVIVLILIIFIAIGISFLTRLYDNVSGDSNYQEEVNGVVSPDFTLVHSQFENDGLDVGSWLTDDYTTRLSPNQLLTF